MSGILSGFVVLAQSDWSDHMDVGDGWWVVMMVGMLVFWAAVALAVAWALRGWAADRRVAPAERTGDSALTVLDRTLAEGKISVEDYERRRRVLTGEPPEPAGGGS